MNVDKAWLFDRPYTQNFTKVRQTFIGEFVDAVRQQMELASALDLGCGVGYFSKFLLDKGFRVVAVDGREENAKEGKRRYPNIEFLPRDMENLSEDELGMFDLVLCVGLLYHLENPFRAIRMFYALTAKVLVIEGSCLPGPRPTMELLDEAASEDQSLNCVAFYPSESCIVKMLYRAGFPYVYLFRHLPADELFMATPWQKRPRTILTASKVPLTAPNLVLAEEPRGAIDPWTTALARLRRLPRRLGSLLIKPLRKWMSPVTSRDAGATSE